MKKKDGRGTNSIAESDQCSVRCLWFSLFTFQDLREASIRYQGLTLSNCTVKVIVKKSCCDSVAIGVWMLTQEILQTHQHTSITHSKTVYLT